VLLVLVVLPFMVVEVLVVVLVVLDVPLSGIVGTTTSPDLVCAKAAELPTNKDKPRLLNKRKFRIRDDINHPQHRREM
ncbi:MAG: hypothetical protein N2235_19770, partial [Fischerella sp.]|nr:hypothetical protein [Fischerella sp.]